jgi:OOP family OmpA-OmpF porin
MEHGHNNFRFVISWLFWGIVLSGFMSGCTSMPEKYPPLEAAREAYIKAEANPDIKDNAPVALYEAQQALERAGNAKNMEELKSLTYIAQGHVTLAEAIAERKKAEKKINRLKEEKERIILESRRIEAEIAHKKAKTKMLEAQQAKERAKELESELSELKAKQIDRGIVLTLGDVLFATGEAGLTSGAMRIIDQLADFLKRYPNRNVRIEGHTDNVGRDEFNLILSEQRANSVKMALIFRGINPDRIMAVGYGEAYPIASNNTEAGRQQNRRVEVVILNKGQK